MLSAMQETPQKRLAEFRHGMARYAPLTRIAAGGMGEVWRGEARFADGYVQEVAIKRVLPHLANNPMYRRMFEDEARLGMLLRHPNIVRVLDARTQGSLILIMEFVEGRSLSQILDRLRAHALSVPVAAALHIGHSIARALMYAHEALDDLGRDLALIHSDVSPHNVLLGVDGRVKLMDFGLARASANLAGRPENRITGKYGYLAPEVLLRRELCQSSDLFALGAVLWECLTGKRLFSARTLREARGLLRTFQIPKASCLNPAVSEGIETLLGCMLTRTPEERIASARALVREFELLMELLPNHVGPDTTARLVRLNLHEKPKSQPPRNVTHLSEEELEEFFAGLPTTTFKPPSLAPAAQELDAFVTECDTGLFAR